MAARHSPTNQKKKSRIGRKEKERKEDFMASNKLRQSADIVKKAVEASEIEQD